MCVVTCAVRLQHRGDEYNALKHRIQDIILKELLALHPELRDRVEFLEVGTPLSAAHFLAKPLGESYGIEMSVARCVCVGVCKGGGVTEGFAHCTCRHHAEWARPRTPIPGLFLTGHDTLSPGLMGAAFSGLVSAIAAVPSLCFDILPLLPSAIFHQ